jgi:glycosyltransferase involved in cell wall biosynthesis
MPSVVHVIVTDGFAGVERHVADTATELASRGWDVTVVGGKPARMRSALSEGVRWLPGATPIQALRALARLGRQDVCHAHMTFAEAVSLLARPVQRAPIVATRHIAARRGSMPLARLVSPLIATGISRELAISQFVARSLERHPDAIVYNGVRRSARLWEPRSRVVLVLQRLEPEKDTLTALGAWNESRMWEDGWALRIVGDGSQRSALEAWVAARAPEAVEFAGWSDDVDASLASAGILLAPAPREALGLATLEAMAAGVPVVASAAGGHLETLGCLPNPKLFDPGDVRGAAARLLSLGSESAREAQSVAGQELVSERFLLSDRVDDLEEQYDLVRRQRSAARGRSNSADWKPNESAPAGDGRANDRSGSRTPGELVVCSLEPWDEVWRRNQHLVHRFLAWNSELRVLFVEPPVDPIFDMTEGRLPAAPRLRRVSEDGRLVTLRPLKLLPRRVGGLVDASLCAQARWAAHLIGFTDPMLWVNDATYAPLIAKTGWSSVYDVTDDWTLAPFSVKERERLRLLDDRALRDAQAVIVCSESLAGSRGRRRSVVLIPNAADAKHFRRRRQRPHEMPTGRTAVYVGSLHDARVDIGLIVDLAKSDPKLSVVLVGPDSLSPRSRLLLSELRNIVCLGSRPYNQVPAFLQHADVVIVPHRVSAFTESLDPIKAYECLAVGTPTVATPVAGFKDLVPTIRVASRESFVSTVMDTVASGSHVENSSAIPIPSWDERAREFWGVLVAGQRRNLRGTLGRVGSDDDVVSG